MAETLRGEMIGPDSRLPTVLPLSQIPHLAHITSDCLRLLEYAAVLGDPFDARQLGALAATSFTDVVTILDEAIAVGLLDETHDGFVFRHDVIHDTLAKEVPTSVRAELHRRCARDLTEYGHDPARVAAHLLGTGLSTSDHDWVRTVAERCVTAAPDRVIPLWRHYSDCAEFDGPRDHRRIEVEVQIAVALLSLGRAKEAEEAARTVLDLMGARDARVTSCLAVALMLQGKYEEARSIAASASVAEELQPWERAEQLALAGAAALLMGDVSVATDELDRAEVGAARAGSAVARIRVLISRGHLAHRRGELARARVLLEEAAALCAGDDSRAGHETFAHAMYGLVLADQDNADDADRAFRQGEEFGLSRGSLITTRFSQVCRALSDVDLGRLDRAIPALDRDLAEPDDITELWQSALLARRALAALYCEGPDAAEHWVRCLLERDWYTSDEYGTAWRPRAVAAVKLARGDVEDAVSVLWCAWQEVMAAGLLIDTRLLATELVDASRRTHDPTKAWNVVEAMEELAGRNPDVPSLAVQLLTVRGMVTEDCDALMAATEMASGLSHRMIAARAAEEAAIALIASGRPEDARDVSRDALESYARVGAAFEAARARAAFRRAGIRVLREHPQERPSRVGWEALTPAEQVVAQFVERGLSNSDISDELVVSRRTVESHVSHILAKLGLRSRGDLILAAARLGGQMQSDKDPGPRRH